MLNGQRAINSIAIHHQNAHGGVKYNRKKLPLYHFRCRVTQPFALLHC